MHPAKVKSLTRQEAILLSLKRLDYLTRRQIQMLHNLKSNRNAQRILKEMDPYLNYFYEGQRIYYLNKDGRERINCNTIRNKITTAQHYIMRNDLYIHSLQPATWRNEIKIISEQNNNEISIIADAYYTRNQTHHIIEIDNTQKMKKNKLKIDKYRRLVERNVFKGKYKIIWVTTSQYRQKALLELCEGFNVSVFLNTDFK